MANINLLPWRDEMRQEKKKEFFTVLVGVAILGALCNFLWIQTVNQSIDSQNSRNSRLDTEIKSLDDKVKEIQTLKKEKEELLARMQVIQDLQGTRPVIVRYFDELVRAVPDGIYLRSVKRTGNTISIEGVGESTNRVSSFMRNLDGSVWFDKPNLDSVDRTTSQEIEQATQQFKMTVTASAPKSGDDES